MTDRDLLTTLLANIEAVDQSMTKSAHFVETTRTQWDAFVAVVALISNQAAQGGPA